jgi:hypothetical protein
MMKALIDTTAPEIGSAQVVPGLAMAANVAAQMLQRAAPGDYSPQAQLLLLCVMTGSIVLIDHLDPQGAFHKGSPIRCGMTAVSLRGFAELTASFTLEHETAFSL